MMGVPSSSQGHGFPKGLLSAVDIMNSYKTCVSRVRAQDRRMTVTVGGITQSQAATRVLSSVAQAHPEIDIVLVDGRNYPPEIALLESHVDAYISPMPSRMVKIDTHLSFIPIAEEQLVALVSAEGPLAKHDAVKLSSLSECTFIHVSEAFLSEPGWAQIEEQCEAKGFIPRSRIYFHSTEPLRLADNEVLILPQSEAERTQRQYGHEEFKIVEISDADARMTTYCITEADPPSRRVRLFKEYIEDAISIA